MLALLVHTATAMTLEDAVARAAEVDTAAVIAALNWRRGKLESAEALAVAVVDVNASANRSRSAGTISDSGQLTITVPLIEPAGWFSAAETAANAGAAHAAADATALDAQYAAAALYYGALGSESALAAATHAEGFARATLTAVNARVAGGLESDLAGRSASINLQSAEASTEAANADVVIARARLARALQVDDVGELTVPGPMALPTNRTTSPWSLVLERKVREAAFAHGGRIAELAPSTRLVAPTNLTPVAGVQPFGQWSVSVVSTWKFDGLVGPLLRERQAWVDVKIARLERDAYGLDLDLAFVEASARARAAARLIEAATARTELADQSVAVAQTRLSVGLASTLEVLRFEEDAATARTDQVAATLALALANLDARRVAGVPWTSP